MKTCSSCNERKALSEFNADKTKRLGVASRCRKCSNARSKTWAKDNKRLVNERSKAWYRRNEELAKARSITWYEAHPEVVIARSSEWRKTNPEKAKASAARTRQRYPEKRNEKARRRHAMRFNQLCICCQTEDAKANFVLTYALARRLKMHVDHVKPLAKGGLHCLHNLQLLPPLENLRKGAKWNPTSEAA